MRNHDFRYNAFECGEGNLCSIAWGPIIGAAIGGGLSFLGSKQQAEAQQEAAELNAAATTPKFYGPGLEYVPTILSDAERLYGYKGFAPDPNLLELLGRRNVLGYAENALPSMVSAAQQSWLQGLDPGLNPYVGAMIEAGQQDLTQDFLRNVMPSISDRAQAVGGYGGSRQGVAQGIAAEGLLEASGDLAARLLSDAYGQSLRQQQAAWSQAPSMAGLGFLPGQTQQDVGALYRQDAMSPVANLQGYQEMVNPYVSTGAGQAVYSASPNPWGAATQGAIGGAMAGNWLGDIFSSTPQAPGTLAPNQLAGYSQGGWYY